jgi:hypothetical protein
MGAAYTFAGCRQEAAVDGPHRARHRGAMHARSLWFACSLASLPLFLGGCPGDDTVETENSLLVTQSGSVVVTLAFIEGDDATAIGVALAAAPDEPLTVTITADPLVSLDRTTLTFTAENFDTPQPVVITPGEDADVIDGAGEIVLSAPDLEAVTLALAVADDDEVGVWVDPDPILVMEDGTAEVELWLDADPGGPISIALASSAPAAATVSAASLDFTSDDWDVPQTVTITGVADGDALDAAITLELSGQEIETISVPLTVLDVDTQNLVISVPALTLTEEGGDGVFTVRLTQPPVGTVTVDVAVEDPAVATLSTSTLTFTGADFDQPHVVTVSPQVDLDGTLDESAVVLTTAGLADRTIELTVAEDAVVDLANVDGEFLMTIRPDLPEDRLVSYRVTYDVDPANATLGYSAIALRVDDSTPVGDTITAGPFALDDDAAFQGVFDGVLPAPANPISGTDVVVDAMKLGAVIDADFLCGTMTGTAGALSLDGTTWASVRITGPGLPEPVWTCAP